MDISIKLIERMDASFPKVFTRTLALHADHQQLQGNKHILHQTFYFETHNGLITAFSQSWNHSMPPFEWRLTESAVSRTHPFTTMVTRSLPCKLSENVGVKF